MTGSRRPSSRSCCRSRVSVGGRGRKSRCIGRRAGSSTSFWMTGDVHDSSRRRSTRNSVGSSSRSDGLKRRSHRCLRATCGGHSTSRQRSARCWSSDRLRRRASWSTSSARRSHRSIRLVQQTFTPRLWVMPRGQAPACCGRASRDPTCRSSTARLAGSGSAAEATYSRFAQSERMHAEAPNGADPWSLRSRSLAHSERRTRMAARWPTEPPGRGRIPSNRSL